MSREISGLLLRQYEIAWSLASYHLRGLSNEECLWRPSTKGPHLVSPDAGSWRGEWPEHEGYDLGPPSIAWLLWHVSFWWSMAIDHSFESVTLDQNAIICPSSADDASSMLHAFNERWHGLITSITDEDLLSHERTRWPFQGRPFGDVVAWVNIELTKNASELGYVRFLYATRPAS